MSREHIISVRYDFMEVKDEKFKRIKNLSFLTYIEPKNFDNRKAKLSKEELEQKNKNSKWVDVGRDWTICKD